jgi:hypothetical protein
MNKFLFFGTGKNARETMNGIAESKPDIEIVGFIDNDESKYGKKFFGFNIYHPGKIQDLKYDYICLLIGNSTAVYNQLVYGYQIQPDKIVDRLFLLKTIMIEKYKNDTNDCIRETLKFWENNDISFLNQFQYEPEQYDEIYWDREGNMPYTYYGGKKMYYPRNYTGFIVRDGKMYAIGYRNAEQHELSPHRYLMGSINIRNGDIVVDGGAREGDFALPYIDIIGRLYVFEGDQEWVKALQMTYKDYSDKVTIIPKMLSDYNDDYTTTLPEVIKDNRVDFIKLDIEGAEARVLKASESLLTNNNIRCSICSYHQKNDQKDIVAILERNGYQCSMSNGLTTFLYDPNFFRDLDFRKGIVYASKKN